MSIRFPYSRPTVLAEDIAAVTGVLETPMLTQGPHIPSLEKRFCNAVSAAHSVACNNGTAALHLAYMGLELGADRGIIVPAVTFLATANAAQMCGAPVHFADVDPATGLVTPETLEAALDTAPFPIAAAAVVHLAGRPCDMVGLKAVADERDCVLVEDACHAPGAVYGDETGQTHKVGACTHSAEAVFSLHAIKHIAAGEGGIVTTADDALADRLRLLRNHGMTRNPAEWTSAPEEDAPWYYEMQELGWNYRLTDIQAALAASQTTRLLAGINKRQEIADRYETLLGDDNRITLPGPVAPGWQHAWHLYPIALEFGSAVGPRAEIMKALAQSGIGTQVHYIPVNAQPYYQRQGARPLPGATAYYQRTLSIPMYETLTAEDQHEIVEILKTVLAD